MKLCLHGLVWLGWIMDYVPFLIFLLYLYMYLLCDNKRLNWKKKKKKNWKKKKIDFVKGKGHIWYLKFWYKFVNNKLPKYFRDMFKFHHELHDIVTRNHDCLHLYPTRTSGARNVLRYHIPELLNKFPQYLIDKIKTHSIYSFAHQIKCYLVDLYSYACNNINCYVCNYTQKWQIAKAETCILWLPRNHWLYM